MHIFYYCLYLQTSKYELHENQLEVQVQVQRRICITNTQYSYIHVAENDEDLWGSPSFADHKHS